MKAQSFDLSALCATLSEFDTATLWETNQGGAFAPGMRPLTIDTRVAGPALTVLCPPGDNLAIHVALADAKAGEILVVQTSDARFGVWGEVMTVAAMARGVTALVVDGSVRDVDSIRKHGFPVFGRSTALAGTSKVAPGAVRVPIMCGGQLVLPGDLVVADSSGVVAIRSSAAASVAERAAVRRDKEAGIMDQLRQGRTTMELLGLKQPDE